MPLSGLRLLSTRCKYRVILSLDWAKERFLFDSSLYHLQTVICTIREFVAHSFLEVGALQLETKANIVIQISMPLAIFTCSSFSKHVLNNQSKTMNPSHYNLSINTFAAIVSSFNSRCFPAFPATSNIIAYRSEKNVLLCCELKSWNQVRNLLPHICFSSHSKPGSKEILQNIQSFQRSVWKLSHLLLFFFGRNSIHNIIWIFYVMIQRSHHEDCLYPQPL